MASEQYCNCPGADENHASDLLQTPKDAPILEGRRQLSTLRFQPPVLGDAPWLPLLGGQSRLVNTSTWLHSPCRWLETNNESYVNYARLDRKRQDGYWKWCHKHEEHDEHEHH